MILYHSSPKLFEAFEDSKIGQTTNIAKYGYGHYFSESLSDVVIHLKRQLQSKQKFYVYEVKVYNSVNIVNYDEEVDERFLLKIASKLSNENATQIKDEYDNYNMTYRELYEYVVAISDTKKTSKMFKNVGITGFKIEGSGWYDAPIYTIFSSDDLSIKNYTEYVA